MAVVVPNEPALQAWAKGEGQAGEFAELCKTEGAKKFILEQLTETGKKGKVSGMWLPADSVNGKWMCCCAGQRVPYYPGQRQSLLVQSRTTDLIPC